MAKRPTHKMPDDVRKAQSDGGVRGDYDARPPYQRNDYVGWIEQAKSDQTGRRRIARAWQKRSRDSSRGVSFPPAPHS